jgi:hypothetical protein
MRKKMVTGEISPQLAIIFLNARFTTERCAENC